MSIMQKYTKRPVTIDAVRLTVENHALISEEIVRAGYRVFNAARHLDDRVTGIIIETLEGNMEASFGDWIIKGIKGEYYPCKDDIFNASYEVNNEGE